MSKEKLKKLTIKDFIAKAKQKEKDKMSFSDIDLKDGSLTVKKLSDKKLLSIMDRVESSENMEAMISVYKEVIFEGVPTLQDEELQKSFELAEPYDIVTKVFELSEIIDIAVKIFDIHGLNDIGEDLKN